MQSYYAKVSSATLSALGLITLLLAVATGGASAQVPCSSVAVFKYPMKACTVTVNRSVPGSPLPVQVPAGTTVTIVVTGQRELEIIKTATTSDAVARPDVAGFAAKQLVGPLASIQLHLAPPRMPLVGNGDKDLKDAQDDMETELLRIADVLAKATAETSCLQGYVTYDSTNKVCTATAIPAGGFETIRQQTYNDVDAAVKETLPYKELSELDAAMTGRFGTCSDSNTIPDPVEATCNQFQGNEKKIDDAFKALQTAQAALAPLGPVLAAIQAIPATIIPPITNHSNIKATVVITAQEQIGKTSSPIGTVVITWQQTNWSISTGVVLSALKNKTFANSPLYSNGVPMGDGSGHTFTQVTVAKSYPGVISPVFFVNYRLHNFQANQGRWAFLFSGGIGANFVTKSADFAAGPSIQYGNVLFTPAVHYGRQTELINGVHVGDQLGTSPPALPTNNVYKPAIGLGITYRLPIM